jgi:hypothetical protein
MVAKNRRRRLATVDTKTFYIEPGSPPQNGHRESFNGKFRNELLNGEIFYILRETPGRHLAMASPLQPLWPRGALTYRPPAPEAILVQRPQPSLKLGT